MSYLASSLAKANYGTDNKSTHIRPAGAVTSFADTAKDALTWNERPSTPDELKKYRQSTLHEPGKIVKHPGLADDTIPGGTYGDRSFADNTGRNVEACVKSYPDSEMARWKLERAEDHYASSKQEPLGKSMVRGHKIPEGPYGRVIDAQGKEKAGQARTIIFPTDGNPTEDPAAHQLYVTSHADYQPGEQRRRNYNWESTGANPEEHRFGAVDKDQYRDGVKKAIHPGLDQSLEQPAKIASKLHEDYKLSAADRLGTVRNLGTGDRNLPETHVFGVNSMRHGPEPGMKELLTGAYPVGEQQPDADLGNKSVSCTVNYGNEPDAFQLLRPPRSVELGVNESHYIKLRFKAEIKDLVADAGIDISDEDFDKVFGMSSEADGEAGACCLDTFFRARNHVLAQTIRVPGF
eukprot:gene7391-517_t